MTFSRHRPDLKFPYFHGSLVPWLFLPVLLLFPSLGACKNLGKAPPFHLEFLNEQVLPKDLRFQGQPVGGLSALVFDKSTGEFLALSDDKRNHRFYKFQISHTPGTWKKKGKTPSARPSNQDRNERPTFQLILREQVFLREKGSSGLNRNMDPEGMDLKGPNLFITSEGQQIFNPPEPPRVFVFSKTGVLKRAWPTMPVFWNEEQLSSFGARENKGFEALTLTEKYLWTATEKALRQDPDRLLRLSGFDLKKGKLLHQYPYFLEPQTGLSEMIALTDKTFLTLERAYNKQTGENQVRLFKTQCGKATNLMAILFLKKTLKASGDSATGPAKKIGRKNSRRFTPCQKNLLFDFAKLPAGITADNLEGMALGPKMAAEGRLLVFTSDNNFSNSQKTQFLFFRLNISHKSVF